MERVGDCWEAGREGEPGDWKELNKIETNKIKNQRVCLIREKWGKLFLADIGNFSLLVLMLVRGSGCRFHSGPRQFHLVL